MNAVMRVCKHRLASCIVDLLLKLHRSRLQNGMSVLRCCSGADYIFHTALPFFNDPKDAQKELVEPAVHGTSNMLHRVANNRRAQLHLMMLTFICL